MSNAASKGVLASAILGAAIAGPTGYFFSGGSALSGVAGVLIGGGALALVRRRADASAREMLVAGALTFLAVVLLGPVILALGGATHDPQGYAAGFIKALFIMAIAGQLFALPLGVFAAVLHLVVIRATRAPRG